MAVDEAQRAEIQAKLKSRDEHMRESWIRAMEARIIRDELKKCQRGEGVNHLENCRWLAEKYATMLKENRVQGYKIVDV
ncbi:hypothetical protein OE88DRAFT_1808968 [Heliocybe sulcata]|uniref:NADH-ubiquinone oxidoreductase 12 kDa subunit n=1 Tax=Heliocybe sulcata TaxID=5364 RepID=A0A5C3MY95_9AGAM|nr:hypothetical protein OE88DRAFT_1808968 [Heliocybe sulcata]